MIYSAMYQSSSQRAKPPYPLIYSIPLAKELREGHVSLRLKSLLATENAKHRAGFILAPGYPAARPTLEKLTRPRPHATSNGPGFGPKTCACLGSRPTPNERKLKLVNIEYVCYRGVPTPRRRTSSTQSDTLVLP
jgi:hypothetical protein